MKYELLLLEPKTQDTVPISLHGPDLDDKPTPGVGWYAARWLNWVLVFPVGRN